MRTFCVCLISAVLIVTGSVLAQERCPFDAFDTVLQYVGEWQVDSKQWIDDEAEHSDATAKMTADLENCLVVERLTGLRMDRAYSARAWYSYDPFNEVFQRAWIDATLGMMQYSQGPLTPEGIEFSGTQLIDGREARLRQIYSRIEDDSFTVLEQRSTNSGRTWETFWLRRYRRVQSELRGTS